MNTLGNLFLASLLAVSAAARAEDVNPVKNAGPYVPSPTSVVADMLKVAEALALVLKHARPLAARRTPLADALGLVLAEDVASDIDMPPYDKSMMDGYAVRFDDLAPDVADSRVGEDRLIDDDADTAADRQQMQLAGTGPGAMRRAHAVTRDDDDLLPAF